MKTKEHGINKAVQKFKVGLDLEKKKQYRNIVAPFQTLWGKDFLKIGYHFT